MKINKCLTPLVIFSLIAPISLFAQDTDNEIDNLITAIIAESQTEDTSIETDVVDFTIEEAEEVSSVAEVVTDERAAEILTEEAGAEVDVAVSDYVADAVDAILSNEADVEPSMSTSTPSAVMLPLMGEDQEEDKVLVSMAFEEVSLTEVVRAFRDSTGANIISAWTNEFTRPVSARLDNVEWSQGLSAIVAGYGLELKEEPRDSSIFVVREKTSADVEQQRRVETFELKHADAEKISTVLQHTFNLEAPAVAATNRARRATATGVMSNKSLTVAFPSANVVVVKGTDDEIDSCRSIIKALDKPAHQVYIEARFVRLSAKASKQLGMRWDSLSDWGASLGPLEGTFSYNDDRFRDSSESTVYSASGRRSDLPARKDQATRSFESTRSRGNESGFSSGFMGQLSVSEFRVAISAFEKMDGAQIFSNPKVIVENATTAYVDMTTREPNVVVKIEDSSSDSTPSKISSQLATIPGKKDIWVGEAFFKYGIELEVTPRVSPSGLITVDIVPSISQRDFSVENDGYRVIGMNRFPIIRMQRLITTFTMADGKTAVIGGLTETTENNVDSGIPLLRSIPFIGPRLFGWKSRVKEQSEIIVFVTVGLADPETMGREVTVDKGAGIGMPMNAVLGRGLLDGTFKEPGERTDEEMFDLEKKTLRSYRVR